MLAAVSAFGGQLILWLVLHVAVVTCAGAVLWRARMAPDLSPQALAVLATLIAGPLGAALAAAALASLARERPNRDLLEAWYDRISLAGELDPVTQLYNSVAMGRAVQTTTAMPQRFEVVMTEGSLSDRQAALGLIARKFEPSYAPALRLALVSPEPVIRVQAAAVAVKVRGELKSSIESALARAEAGHLAPAQQAELAYRIAAMAHSGLLEDTDHAQAREAVRHLLGSVTAAIATEPPDAGFDALAEEARTFLETELLRRGAFAAFRSVRGSATAVTRRDREDTPDA
jgi:hypothetical protein